MTDRLSASLIVGALLRRAEGVGGFGAVLKRGESTSGAILIALLEKGEKAGFLERVLQPGGGYSWASSGPAGGANDEERQRFLQKRRRIDPDLWILELDVPSQERFAAEMTSFD